METFKTIHQTNAKWKLKLFYIKPVYVATTFQHTVYPQFHTLSENYWETL